MVYTQVDPGISEDENLANAKALIDEWGIGRSGFDDGMVLMVGLEENRINGRVSMFGGSGFLGAYANEDALKGIIESDLRSGRHLGRPRGRRSRHGRRGRHARHPRRRGTGWTMLRVANAGLGLVVAPIVLVGALGLAWNTWRREGDDPELTDSPSILMAGPPADMTPPLATVVRSGTGTDHTVNTLLAELASTGRLSFHNLDHVASARSDHDPDPLTDPAIEVHAEVGDDGDLKAPQREAWTKLKALGRRVEPAVARAAVAGELGPRSDAEGLRVRGRPARLARTHAGTVDRSHVRDRDRPGAPRRGRDLARHLRADERGGHARRRH